MVLHTGPLYWPTTLRKPYTAKTATQPKKHYDAVIIGGGMAGCLTAYKLLQKGFSVAILEKNRFGQGSTAANTGLLQFSNDIMLSDLMEEIGKEDAVRFYQLCYEALDDIENIVRALPEEVDFIRRPSIFFASNISHAGKLKEEYSALYENNFPCEYWEALTLSTYMPFYKPGAIVTYHDAEINPLKFLTSLLTYLQDRGVDLFEETDVRQTTYDNNAVLVQTNSHLFHARHVIDTIGYEKEPNTESEITLFTRSYVMVTKPIESHTHWHKQAMIREANRPSLSLRTTAEGAIMVGGVDNNADPAPNDEKMIEEYAQKLLLQVKELFPHLELEVDTCYTATLAYSKDKLPIIGAQPAKPNHYYLLGYGGNETIYGSLGSKIICDLIAGRENTDALIVSPKRKKNSELSITSIA